MVIKLKVIKEDRPDVYVEWAAPEGAKTVVATEKGMLRKFEDDSDKESSEE